MAAGEPSALFCEAVSAAYERIERRTGVDRVTVRALWEDLERDGLANGSLSQVLAWDATRRPNKSYVSTIATVVAQGRCPPLALVTDTAGEPVACIE